MLLVYNLKAAENLSSFSEQLRLEIKQRLSQGGSFVRNIARFFLTLIF